MRRALSILVLLLAGCSGAAPRSTEIALREIRESDQVASLEYELNGRSIPMPFVRGAIGTHETIFMIDTGSNGHVLASWFAEECGLPITHTPRTASTHAPMPLVDHPLITIQGFGDVDIPVAVVGEIPAVYEEMGVGGVLSPQMLITESTAVVLDLQRDTLSRVPRTNALDLEGVEGEFLTRTPVGICEEVDGGIVFRSLLLRATVGGQDAQLQVSIGMGTSVAPSRLASPGQSVPVNVGFVSRTLEVGVSDDIENTGRCARNGLLGRDFLANCVLVFDGDRAAGRCAE